jgi:hypothetical protein
MPPKYLYKFEKLNVQTLRNLKNAQVYFNTAASFNDPFDCSVLEASVILGDNELIEIYKRFLKDNKKLANIEINSVKDIPKDDINKIHEAVEKNLKTEQNRILTQRGCTCFSEVNDNILLWSHYADGHKGICLEFDTSFPLFTKVKEVKYSQNFPSMDPIKMLFGSVEEMSEEWEKPICTKYECWNYEKEWRVFHEKPNMEFGYSVEALKSVYFGMSVNFTDLEIVCLTLLGQRKDIKFYKAYKDKSRYALSFEEFTYTPNIEAKK